MKTGPIYLDFETCGLCGPSVLLQWAENEGEIHLEDLWFKKISEVIELFEYITNHQLGIIGFNLAFDWFHLQQMYTVLLLMKNKSEQLINCIDEYVENEPLGRNGPCCRPYKACDLMLLARRTSYQSLLDRKNVRIKKIPNQLAYQLANELEKRLRFKEIYFAKRKKDIGGRQWEVRDRPNDPEFKDIVLAFKASSGLKPLAIDALNLDSSTVSFYGDIEPGVYPDELNYAPWARAAIAAGLTKPWPTLIKYYAEFWRDNVAARKYATDDVHYTRALYHYFNDPPLGDTDSELACMVGSCRWKGYALNLESIRKLREEVKQRLKVDEFDPNHVPTAPSKVKPYLKAVMSPIEQLGLISTNKKTLKDLAEDDPIWEGHPVRERAKLVIKARDDKYHLDLYNKLLRAGRFHPDFKVGGALSGRMSGGSESEGKKSKKGSINPQGIPRLKYIRQCFPLADPDTVLLGGDMESFEVALAAACYNDQELTKDLCKCWMCGYTYHYTQFLDTRCPGCGKYEGKESEPENTRTKIHGLFGMALFPGKSYAEVRGSKGSRLDMYDLGKRGVFATIYQGNEKTLEQRLQINIQIAKEAQDRFMNKYVGIKFAQLKIKEMFESMSQPKGLGTKVIWRDPEDYIESMLGYRRYFTLENSIVKTLFELAEDPPKQWLELKLKVIRRDRPQYVGNAIRSALFASAFGIQGHNKRAAGNHQIQSTGATITKEIQEAVWSHQPKGINPWIVQPFQCHDEVMCPTHPDHVKQITKTVLDKVETYRSKVPLISIGWKENIKDWSQK